MAQGAFVQDIEPKCGSSSLPQQFVGTEHLQRLGASKDLSISMSNGGPPTSAFSKQMERDVIFRQGTIALDAGQLATAVCMFKVYKQLVDEAIGFSAQREAVFTQAERLLREEDPTTANHLFQVFKQLADIHLLGTASHVAPSLISLQADSPHGRDRHITPATQLTSHSSTSQPQHRSADPKPDQLLDSSTSNGSPGVSGQYVTFTVHPGDRSDEPNSMNNLQPRPEITFRTPVGRDLHEDRERSGRRSKSPERASCYVGQERDRYDVRERDRYDDPEQEQEQEQGRERKREQGRGRERKRRNSRENNRTSHNHAQRLWVGNMLHTANKTNLITLLNAKMKELGLVIRAQEGILVPIGDNPVVNVLHDRDYAFVDFVNAELASYGLSLDGIIFDNKRLKIRRPKGYNGNAEHVGMYHLPGVISSNVVDSPNKVYIGNLPLHENEEQILERLKPFGELKRFRLFENSFHGSSRFVFCEYVNPGSTDIVCEQLNGRKIGETCLVVRKAFG